MPRQSCTAFWEANTIKELLLSGMIYLRRENELVELRDQLYDSEALLQELLAKYPNLLAGEQMDAANPRRWVLVSREMAVPDEDEGAGRWSLDHLFLDQDAVPTLVEVKRSTDTRLRREVVGQLLDYAANAVVYWPVESLRSAFEARFKDQSEADEAICGLIGGEANVEKYWQDVKTNLQAGRIRLVFVADIIPPELQRIVEFLNDQMDPAEVLAVEIKQFVGSGIQTLVPRVIGVKQKVGPSPGPSLIPGTVFFQRLAECQSKEVQDVVRKIISWSQDQGLLDVFKQGKQTVFAPEVVTAERRFNAFKVDDRGRLVILMRRLKSNPPFCEESNMEWYREKIRRLPGLIEQDGGVEGFPQFNLSELVNPERLQNCLRFLAELVSRLRAANGSMPR